MIKASTIANKNNVRPAPRETYVVLHAAKTGDILVMEDDKHVENSKKCAVATTDSAITGGGSGQSAADLGPLLDSLIQEVSLLMVPIWAAMIHWLCCPVRRHVHRCAGAREGWPWLMKTQLPRL